MARTKAKQPEASPDKPRRIVVSREPPLDLTSTQVRAHLERALDAMLVGPFLPDQGPDAERWGERAGQEVLHIAPSRWYLTGFLVPEADERSGASDAGDDLDDELERPDGDGDSDSEPTSRTGTVRVLPASLGLTVLLPPHEPGSLEYVTLTLRYADYHALGNDQVVELLGKELPLAPGETAKASNKEVEQRKRARKLWWKRMPQLHEDLRVRVVEETDKPEPQEVSGSRRLEIVHQLREIVGVPGVPDRTRALSVFVVNRRTPPGETPDELSRADESKIFQVGLELRYSGGLFARVDRRFAENDRADFDDQVADLQYRDVLEWAVGHSVATEPIHEDGRVIGAKTVWLPRRFVAKVRPGERADGVTVELAKLAELLDGAAVRRALAGLPTSYAKWITEQRDIALDDDLQDTRASLVRNAERAKDRLIDAIELLATDAEVRRAFCLTNQAMLDQALAGDRRRPNPIYTQNGGKLEPKWYLFQLAFVLLNLRGIAEPQRERERECVELLYFPTGGGKTEAYLGVIAFTLLLRRLRGRTREDRGYGVAVMLRYTLRLLTLDQFERAARLICALELLRRDRVAELGELRFSVGLWVGATATANTLRDAVRRRTEWMDDGDDNSDPPAPLTECPWCGRSIGYKKNGVEIIGTISNPKGIRLECGNRACAFFFRRPENEEYGLPVLYVDEQIYRELPCFLLATVDKFAMMPFRGETGMLFGRVHSRQGLEFFGPLDSDGPSSGAQRLPTGLRPPELIVQDELHLISGPLGTMVGLYESVLERMCRVGQIGPKIIAATATVRRADHQIAALFGGRRVEIFPPRGTSVWDSFFAEEDTNANRREYLGVAAPGRSLKRVMLNVYTTLLGAAARCWNPDAPLDCQQAADPYMTLVGYFNSLRELSGTTRLVEDQVHAATQSLHERKPVDFNGPHPWLAARKLADHPVELTSREFTDKIKRAKSRLAWLAGRPGAIDVVLASNMIGTGIDIDRLGLMVIAGQPKSTSDYIQGSSRVGRDDKRPGLVVTLYNMHKPRDRSHFEHFGLYHDTFYRAVESKSVTPFSLPALERGLTGVLMAMVRLENQAMTPKDAVLKIEQHRRAGDEALDFLVERARSHRLDGDEVAINELAAILSDRGKRTLDDWGHVARNASTIRVYSDFDVKDRRGNGHEGNPLLRTLEQDLRDPAARSRTDDEARFAAPTSMRDVEPVVHLWVRGRH